MSKSCTYYGEHLAEWRGKWTLLPPLVEFPMTFSYAACRVAEHEDQFLTFDDEIGLQKRSVTIRIPLNTCLVFDEHEEPASLC
jgi:hypothetical protein